MSDEVDAAILRALDGLAAGAPDRFGLLVLRLEPARLTAVVERLRADCGFELLLDLTAVDYPGRAPRFELVYHLKSPRLNRRVRLKLGVEEGAATVPTLSGQFGSARYLEREAHEMFGIGFAGNPDLRPILLYEGFVGHPLRKDYPIDREQPIVDYRR